MTVDEEIFLKMVGYFLQDDNDEKFPLYVNEAYHGNFDPLLEDNKYYSGGVTALYMSTFCHEEARRYPWDSLKLAKTYTRRLMGKEVYEICGQWGDQETPEWLNKPLEIDCPVLLLSAELPFEKRGLYGQPQAYVQGLLRRRSRT